MSEEENQEKEDEKEEEKKTKKEKKGKDKKKGKEEKKEKEKEKEKEKNKENMKKEEATQNNENNLNLKGINTNVNKGTGGTTDNIPSSFPIQIQSSLQVISSINNEMDSLSNVLKTKFMTFSSPSLFNQNINCLSNFNINNDNNLYDKEDFEIKALLAKTKIAINETEHNLNNLKLKNLFNKKYENKIIQSDDIPYTINNNIPNFTNKNKNYNTISNNYQNSYFNEFENNNNKYINKRNSNGANYLFEKNKNKNYNNDYYINSKFKSLNKESHHLNRKDFLNNNYNNENINNKYENSIFQENKSFNNHYRNEDDSLNKSLINKTKKIEDLYKYTHNIRRKPMVYKQPDSPPLNNNLSMRQKNFSVDNKFKNSNVDTFQNMKKNNYTRFDNEGVNTAIDILTGKI